MNKVSRLVILILCLCSLISNSKPLLVNHEYGVTADGVRIRASPDVQAAVVGKLRKGAVVRVVEAADEWAKIKSGSVSGYVKNNFLEESELATGGNSTFVSRFKKGFGSFFMVVLIGVGIIQNILTRKNDSRFKTGYRLKKPGLGDAIIIGSITALICSAIGLVTGIAGFF